MDSLMIPFWLLCLIAMLILVMDAMSVWMEAMTMSLIFDREAFGMNFCWIFWMLDRIELLDV